MPVLNIAHRGARSLAPENTLAAARKALEIGADLWETDVMVTADGELILMHDDSLARTTDAEKCFPDRAPWTVSTFTLDEIHQLDPGTHFIETDPFGQIAAGFVTPGELLGLVCQGVPTLAQALILTQHADWRINLELKLIPPPMNDFPVVERVLETIRELNIDVERVTLSSFNHAWLHKSKGLAPEIAVQALVGVLPDDPDPAFDTYNAWAEAVDEEKVRAAVNRGLRVNIYTVNEESDMLRFIKAGVSGLFTDFPQRLKALQY